MASRLRPAHAIVQLHTRTKGVKHFRRAKVGSFSFCLNASLEVSVFPRYRASRADRSFPRSECSRTPGPGACPYGESGMLYIRSATTTISFVGVSGHAHGSSHIRAYSEFQRIVQGQ